jgi:hypothetical protein
MSRRPLRRRGGWPPSIVRTPRERREYLAAFGMVAALQLAIAVSLSVAAAQTYRMWKNEVPYLPGEMRRVIPILLGLGGAVALLSALRTLGRLRALWRAPMEPPPGD